MLKIARMYMVTMSLWCASVRCPTIIDKLGSIGIRYRERKKCLTRVMAREGKVFDGMDTFVTLNIAKSGVTGHASGEGFEGRMVVVDDEARWLM